MSILPEKMSNSQYHKSDGISSSDLKLLEVSPLHLENKELFTYESDVFDLGSLVHKMVLEPDDLEKEFIKLPEFNRKD